MKEQNVYHHYAEAHTGNDSLPAALAPHGLHTDDSEDSV